MVKLHNLFGNEFLSLVFKFYSKLEYAIYFFVCIAFSTSSFMIVYYKKYFQYLNLKWLILWSIILVLLLIMLIFNLKKKYQNISNLFIMFAIPIGLLYMFFLLPTYVPDEQAHFFRAYDISEGNFITDMDSQKEVLPSDILKLENETERATNYFSLVESFGKYTNYYSNEREIFNSAESYPFTMYIFSSLGCFIGKQFSLNLYLVIYICRMLNFIMFIILGYYTIKVLPFGKLLMFVYLLNPMLMQEAISISADSFINATCLMFIAFSLKLMFKEYNILSISEKIIFLVLIICVSFSKYVYFPLAFIAILLVNLKKRKIGDNVFFMISCILAIVFAGISCYIGMQYDDIRLYVIENNVNSTSQIKYILDNPLKYVQVLKETVIEKGDIYFFNFLGHDLGLLTIEGNYVSSCIYFVLLCISCFFENNNNALKKLHKIWFVSIFIGIFILILTGLYMGWTTVGGEIVQGVQGRYFIPILILPLMCLIFKNKYVEFKYTNFFITLLLCFINYISIVSIIKFF